MQSGFYYEVDKFVYYILLGVVCGIVFDVFAALRYKKTVNLLTVIIQDMFFYLIITILTFGVMLRLNSAELRFYIFFGFFLGFLVYRITISKKVVALFVWIGKCLKRTLKIIANITIFPILKLLYWLFKPILMLKRKFLRKKLKFALTFKSFCFKIKCNVLKLFSGIEICKERKPCRKKQRPQKRV